MIHSHKLKSSRVVSFILVLVIIMLSLQVTSVIYAGTEPQYLAEADYLNSIGLFRGTTTGYNLELAPNRQQGAVMVVRLLGKEQEAINANHAHPFKDVDQWADAYVGYLYANGITAGQSDTLYGAEDLLTDHMYMTFILRILGYTTPNDFQWDESIEKAYTLGVLGNDDLDRYQGDEHTFLRDDMVYFSYLILDTEFKNVEQTLYERLVEEQVIVDLYEKGYVTSTEMYYPYRGISIDTAPVSHSDLQRALEVMIYNWTPEVSFDITDINKDDIKEVVLSAIDEIRNQPGYFSAVSGYSFSVIGNDLTIEFNYVVTKNQIEAAKLKADQVIAQIIRPDMTEFEKELAIHDYIIDHTVYDQSYELSGGTPFSMYGVLNLGKAVCQGYAEAFDYLSALAGVESQVVVGEVVTNGEVIGHAWNLVKLEGDYYHVDATWDDPTTSDGSNVKNYFYFNITDDEIGYNHFWDRGAYPKATGTAFNYYEVNNLVVFNDNEMVAKLRASFSEKLPVITLKYKGYDLGNDRLKALIQEAGNGYFSALNFQINPEIGVIEVSNINYK